MPADSAAGPHPGRAADGDAAGPDLPRLDRALDLVRELRAGCPWDASQTAWSLRPYLLEEAHEVAEAILQQDEAGLAEELGDLLLNLAFQIVLAEERRAFDAARVVEALEAKMRRRHPHLYGDAAEPPDWEAMKARERRRADGSGRAPTTDGPGEEPFRGLPAGLDPLSRAARVQDRAAGVGFDWPGPEGALDKLREEIRELEAELARGPHGGTSDGPRAPASSEAGAAAPREGVPTDSANRRAEEVGDLLFTAVNVARLADVHPAAALAGAARRFERRFTALLERCRERGIAPDDASPGELERIWQEIKAPADS